MQRDWFTAAMAAGLWVLIGVTAGSAAAADQAPGFKRYFHSGDGVIFLVNAKTDGAYHGRYRNPDGSYDPAAVAAIHEVFGAHYGQPDATIALRLVEFLDLLEDRLNPGARILIVSGFRSPEYNQGLRDRGGIVAKASLHQYGMAADIILEGVPARTIWDYVKDLHFGGAGYYHGTTVHLDVGPARFWDESSSKVHTDISDHNKSIKLITEYDRYRPGEPMDLRFIQMTAFPIGVTSNWMLERVTAESGRSRKPMTVQPVLAGSDASDCRNFSSIEAMTGIGWRLPPTLPAGRYRICAPFCQRLWEAMPAEACTPAFEVAVGTGP